MPRQRETITPHEAERIGKAIHLLSQAERLVLDATAEMDRVRGLRWRGTHTWSELYHARNHLGVRLANAVVYPEPASF